MKNIYALCLWLMLALLGMLLSWTARAAGRSGHAVGDAVHLNWPLESVHLFDAATGRRL